MLFSITTLTCIPLHPHSRHCHTLSHSADIHNLLTKDLFGFSSSATTPATTMSPSTHRRIAIAGITGNLGSQVTKTLVEQFPQHTYILLARASTLEQPAVAAYLKHSHVQSLAVDVLGDTVEQITAALTAAKAEVVISFLSNAHDGKTQALTVGQAKLIQAAAAAPSIQLFVPSEFGLDLSAVGRGSILAPFLDAKLDHRDLLAAAHQKRPDFHYAVVATGSFAEWLVATPLNGVDIKGNTLTALGGLNGSVTATSLGDIGVGLEHLISHADYNSLDENSVHFGSATVTNQQLKDTLEQVTGKQFTVKTPTVEQLQAQLKEQESSGSPSALFTKFHILFAERSGLGQGVAWPLSESYLTQHNLQQTTLQEVVKRVLQSHS